MKTNKFSKFILGLVLLMGTVSSCVEDSEFDTPQVNCQELPQGMVPTSTIAQIKATYTFPPKTIQSDVIIEGYVVSSDESGNLYKTISIQDKPENPTAGIKILIDETDSHVKYNVGRKIMVNLKGLAINKSYDVFEIGFIRNEDVTNIPLPNIKNHIFRTCEVKTIVPKVITLAELNTSHFDMLIQLDNMQFRREDVNKNLTYAQANISVNRKVENFDSNCIKRGEIILRNSSFSDFANTPLPSGKGSLVVIPGKFSNDFQLYIRDLNDVKFNNPFCVEKVLFTLFQENFSTVTSGADISLTGWTNFAQEGTFRWRGNSVNSGVAEFNPFNSGQPTNIGWLITPQINLDTQSFEQLEFKVERNFSAPGMPDLEVFYSKNWDGTTANITTATWTKFALVFPATTGTYFTHNVDLSQITGKIHIAFKATNTGGTSAFRWRVDDVKITAAQ